MKQKLHQTFARLETQRREIISQYQTLTREQLRFTPGPEEWNLLQVLRHIVTAEQQSLLLIKRKIRQADTLPEAGIENRVRHLLLKLALKLPVKFKAPKIAQVDNPHPDLEEAKSDWDEVRNELRLIIKSSDTDLFHKMIYKHPRAGALTIKQALEFFRVHISHHQKQMERIMSRPEFPRSN